MESGHYLYHCVYTGLYPGGVSAGFRAARFNQAGDTRSEVAMSQLNFTQNNKHNSPEFYLGIARACPGLEPPMGGVKTGELVKVKMGSGEDRR